MRNRLTAERNQRAKAYRGFLLRYNRLTDRAWYDGEQRTRKPNSILEYRRHHRLNWPPTPVPSLTKVDAHLSRHDPSGRKEDTIFFINDCSFKQIICNIDIDTTESPLKAQELAEYILAHWLDGQGIIDISPGATGRHVMFKVDTTFDVLNRFTGCEIRNLLKVLKTSVLNDPFVKSFTGAKFCSLLGEPTYWNKAPLPLIEHRGSVVKAPYFYGDVEGGIRKFLSLNAFPLAAIYDAVVRRKMKSGSQHPASSIPLPPLEKLYMGVTTPVEEASELTGPQKKRLCVKTLCRRWNRPITVEEALSEYEANYYPTGSSTNDQARRHREMAEMVEFYNSTFRPMRGCGKYSFSRTKYLEQCQKLVPPTAFLWSRRERLNHQRLADFVSLKIQDAFFRKATQVARASRDASIQNTRILKAKGMLDWVLNSHTYGKLLQIAVEYELLKIYDEFQQPTRDDRGKRIGKGTARMIGPGEALEEEWKEFQPIYEAFVKAGELPEFLSAQHPMPVATIQ